MLGHQVWKAVFHFWSVSSRWQHCLLEQPKRPDCVQSCNTSKACTGMDLLWRMEGMIGRGSPVELISWSAFRAWKIREKQHVHSTASPYPFTASLWLSCYFPWKWCSDISKDLFFVTLSKNLMRFILLHNLLRSDFSYGCASQASHSKLSRQTQKEIRRIELHWTMLPHSQMGKALKSRLESSTAESSTLVSNKTHHNIRYPQYPLPWLID